MSNIGDIILNEPELQLVLMKKCLDSKGSVMEKRRTIVLSSLAYDHLNILLSNLTKSILDGKPIIGEEKVLASVVLQHFADEIKTSFDRDHKESSWALDDDMPHQPILPFKEVPQATKSPGTKRKSKTTKSKTPVVDSKSKKSVSAPKPSTEKQQEQRSGPAKPRTFKQMLKHEFGRSAWVEKLLDVYTDKIRVCRLEPVMASNSSIVLKGDYQVPNDDLHVLSSCQICRDNSSHGTQPTANRVDMIRLALAHLGRYGITNNQIDTVMLMLSKHRDAQQAPAVAME